MSEQEQLIEDGRRWQAMAAFAFSKHAGSCIIVAPFGRSEDEVKEHIQTLGDYFVKFQKNCPCELPCELRQPDIESDET
jgi:hypothetical protein